MIELVGVWYSYGGSSWALRDVSASFGEGELVAVVGPNGAGKSTLLKIASLIYRPARGAVLVDGADFWSLGREGRERARRDVVYVHERPILVRGTALYNVSLGLVLRGVDRGHAERRALEVMEELGIAGLAHRSASALSAGQAQLVAIARALALEPRHLFLDEPFAHLDRRARRALSELLRRRVEEGMGMAMAGHEGLELLRISRKLVVEEGAIVEDEESN
ncbi:MAG: energy-coupling factor ABC transporter ATP-binding protein [Desulfurococcaceae archaeon]